MNLLKRKFGRLMPLHWQGAPHYLCQQKHPFLPSKKNHPRADSETGKNGGCLLADNDIIMARLLLSPPKVKKTPWVMFPKVSLIHRSILQL